MKATIDIPANGDRCGECQLQRFEENPNGWSWVCLLFSMRLTERYWRSDAGWKVTKSRDTSTLKRCRDCVAATDPALASEQEGSGS